LRNDLEINVFIRRE